MDLILSTALTSVTYAIYLFKKNKLNELKNTKPFPCSSKSDVEVAETALENDITYYLEGLITPIKPNQFITCNDNKKKAVILKNIIKRHYVKWSNFWKDWLPEVEVISLNGQTVPFNIYKHNQAQATLPKLSIQDIINMDLPIISDNFISQNKKSIVKSIIDYVNGERFNGIENMEQGYTIGDPITIVGKFKKPIPTTSTKVQDITPTPSKINSIKPTTTTSSLDPDDLLIQSTGLPILIPDFNSEDAYCIISPKTFKEIVEEEAKEINKWKWFVIGSTSIIGGVIAFRLWRHYRKKRREEEEEAVQNSEELTRLQAATLPSSSNPGIFDMLIDIVNWLLMDDSYDIHQTSSLNVSPTPITEYIPEPLPNDLEETTPSEHQNENGVISSSSLTTQNSNISPPSTFKHQSNGDNSGTKDKDTASSNNENVCVVCLTEKREYAFLPCRHLCVCHHCVHYLERCPLCRSPIQNYMKIFS
ncbi:hypothetical protein BCR36DRAFT_407248 [Piromyces finnis]|uniref:RING-type domain-containing protein n=1 Tax=Piromyces finnis TaxID=1754191 RepID=A0A1Y1UWW1_9FUNG|nr:hypothetical protein BCR36DRAFT_407248 [Piromyces finnis]|eukprot:ORX41991.1 hypothetical protein BCR36DRAFT_407248 [Piromyces finnis]